MANDPLTLVNLACVKYTGVPLPVNYNGSPEWSYKLVDGKKRAKYNPYKSTLLSNPFVTISDSHPIEQKIKRNMIVGELNRMFQRDLNYEDILSSLCDKVGHPFITDDSLIPWDERMVLRMIGLNYLSWRNINEGIELPHQKHSFTQDLNDLYDADNYEELVKVKLNTHYARSLTTNLNDIIIQNRDRLPQTYQLLVDRHRPDKEKIRKITERLCKESPSASLRLAAGDVMGSSFLLCGLTSIDKDNRRSRMSIGRALLNDISTNQDYPIVKKDTWWGWFYLYLNVGTYQDATLPEVNRKRSTKKVNWWGEVKKQSGKYDPRVYQHEKTNYKKRLMGSILNQ